MAFVQAPAQTYGGVHGVHRIQGDPQGTDSALEDRRESQVELKTVFFKQITGLLCLLTPGFGKIDIGPASKPVLQVPLAFAVPHQYKFIHGKNSLEVEKLAPLYNRVILPFFLAFLGNQQDLTWTSS